MIGSTEFEGMAYEYDSPVEFVLIATVGGERCVVAKSKCAGIDLMYHSHILPINREKRKFSRFYEELQPFSVDSEPLENFSHTNYDDRLSELTLVWRGVADAGFLEKVTKEFNKIAPEIVRSLDINGRRLDWSLSPVIAMCNDFIGEMKVKRMKNKASYQMMGLIILLYGVVAAVTAVYMMFFKGKVFN